MKAFCSTWYCGFAIWFWILFFGGEVCVGVSVVALYHLLFWYPTDSLFSSAILSLLASWIFAAFLPFSFILVATERKEWELAAGFSGGCGLGILFGIISVVSVYHYPIDREEFYDHILHGVKSHVRRKHEEDVQWRFPDWLHSFQSQRRCCGLKSIDDYRVMSEPGQVTIPFTCVVNSVFNLNRLAGQMTERTPALNASSVAHPHFHMDHAEGDARDGDNVVRRRKSPETVSSTPAFSRERLQLPPTTPPPPNYYTTGCLDEVIKDRDWYRELLLCLDVVLLVGSVSTLLMYSVAYDWIQSQPMVVLTNRVYLRTTSDRLTTFPKVDSDEAVSIDSGDY